jgi:chromosome segregation ATPase
MPALIEAVMLAALGFLVATVLWLIMLPAISRRAERLARRRAELTFPLSVDEISAERDHLRAEFAVRQRELERRLAEATAVRAQALAATGQRDMQISELKTTIGVRDMTIVNLDNNLGATRTELAETQARLASEQSSLAQALSDLQIRGQALADRDKDVAGLRVERADLTAELAQRTRDLDAATQRGDGLAADLAATSTRLASLEVVHEALEREHARLRLMLAESETLSETRAAHVADLQDKLAGTQAALVSEQAAHGTTRSAFEQRGIELATFVAERDSLRLRLKAADDTVARLEQTLHELQSARATVEAKLAAARKEEDKTRALLRDGAAEKARLEVEFASARRERDARIEALTSDLATARAALTEARTSRAALTRELGDLRRDAERVSARLAAESNQLRSEIMKVADQFLAARQKAAPMPAKNMVGKPANEAEPVREARSALAAPAQEQDAAPSRPRRPARIRQAQPGNGQPVPTRAAE